MTYIAPGVVAAAAGAPYASPPQDLKQYVLSSINKYLTVGSITEPTMSKSASTPTFSLGSGAVSSSNPTPYSDYSLGTASPFFAGSNVASGIYFDSYL